MSQTSAQPLQEVQDNAGSVSEPQMKVMSRSELQKLAKTLGVRANMKSTKIISEILKAQNKSTVGKPAVTEVVESASKCEPPRKKKGIKTPYKMKGPANQEFEGAFRTRTIFTDNGEKLTLKLSIATTQLSGTQEAPVTPAKSTHDEVVLATVDRLVADVESLDINHDSEFWPWFEADHTDPAHFLRCKLTNKRVPRNTVRALLEFVLLLKRQCHCCVLHNNRNQSRSTWTQRTS